MYQVEWLIRNKIMLITAEGSVTEGELRSGISLKHVMLTDTTIAGQYVHCLIDHRRLKSLPLDPALRLKLGQSEEEHNGWTIHIQPNPLSRRLTDLTTRLLVGRNIKTMNSIEAAVAFLKTQDNTIVESSLAGI